ncbi:hypothetical protein HK100_007201, partial [Physocladia obscura]
MRAVTTPHGHVISARVTAGGVALWGTRPHALLATCARGPITVAEDGANLRIVWKPDASALVVITDKGFLHFYDISFDLSAPNLQYRFETSHHFARGPGEARGILGATISFKMALEIDTGIRSGVGLDDEILFCTLKSPSILSLSWLGVVNEIDTVSLIDLNFVHDAQSAIVQICSNNSMDLFSWITDDGKAYVSRRLEESDSESQFSNNNTEAYIWAGLCIHNANSDSAASTCTAINSRFLLISVGDAQGHVTIYSISEDGEEIQYSHELGFPDNERKEHGIVSCMEWTADGTALAVGWELGGLSVWSVFGKLLFTTTSSDQFEDLNFWNAGNYELVVHSNR